MNGASLPEAQWEKQMQIVDVESNKQADIQSGFVREQVVNLSRELSSLRQDVNTLRLADSQHEVQAAEMARHLREMQASFRTELQASFRTEFRLELSAELMQRQASFRSELLAELTQRQELTSRLESDVALAMEEARRLKLQLDQSDQSREVQILEERLGQDLTALDNRISKVADGFEARLADKQDIADRAEAENLINKLSEEVSLLKADKAEIGSRLTAQLSDTTSSEVNLRQAMRDVQNQIQNDIKVLRDSHAASLGRIESFQLDIQSHQDKVADVKDSIAQISREHASRHAEIQDRVQHVQRETSARHSDLKDLVSGIADQHASRDSELRQLITELSEQERAASEEHKQGLVDMVKQAHAEVWNELSDHKVGTVKSMEAMISRERLERDDAHGCFNDRLGEVDQKFGATFDKLKKHQEGHSSALGDLEERLRIELSEHIDALKNGHQEHKDIMRKIDDAHNGRHVNTQQELEQKLNSAIIDTELKLKQEILKLKQGLDAHKDNIRDSLCQERQNREQHHAMLAETHETLDFRLQEALMKMQADQEVRHAGLRTAITSTERKMRDDLSAVSAEHHAKHSDHRDQMAKAVGELFESFSELKDQLAKTTASHRGMHDEHRDRVAASVQDIEAKLRREISSAHEASKDAAQDHMLKERQDRENAHASLVGTAEELERRLKDTQSQMATLHASQSATAVGALNALERKLREESAGHVHEHHSRVTELKEQLQKALNDHGMVHAELRDLHTRSAAENKRTLEEHRNSILSMVEAFESKLRREIGLAAEKHQGTMREHLSQERTVRERTHASFLERLSELERKVLSELATASMAREAIHTELRDVVSSACAKERAHMTGMLGKEQEHLIGQLDCFQKILQQEQMARDSQFETLRIYLTQDKSGNDEKFAALSLRAEAVEGSLQRLEVVTRDEFEGAIQRLWEVVDNHTHDVQATHHREVEVKSPMLSRPRSASPLAMTVGSTSPQMYTAPVQPLHKMASSGQFPDVLKDTVLAASPPSGLMAVGESVPLSMGSLSGNSPFALSQSRSVTPLGSTQRNFTFATQPQGLDSSAVAAVGASATSPSSPFHAKLPSNAGVQEALSMASLTVLGVDRNRDGIPDILQGLPAIERVLSRSREASRVQTQEILSSTQAPTYPMELRDPTAAKEVGSPGASPALRSSVTTEPASPANTLPISPSSPMGMYGNASVTTPSISSVLSRSALAPVP